MKGGTFWGRKRESKPTATDSWENSVKTTAKQKLCPETQSQPQILVLNGNRCKRASPIPVNMAEAVGEDLPLCTESSTAQRRATEDSKGRVKDANTVTLRENRTVPLSVPRARCVSPLLVPHRPSPWADPAPDKESRHSLWLPRVERGSGSSCSRVQGWGCPASMPTPGLNHPTGQ